MFSFTGFSFTGFSFIGHADSRRVRMMHTLAPGGHPQSAGAQRDGFMQPSRSKQRRASGTPWDLGHRQRLFGDRMVAEFSAVVGRLQGEIPVPGG